MESSFFMAGRTHLEMCVSSQRRQGAQSRIWRGDGLIHLPWPELASKRFVSPPRRLITPPTARGQSEDSDL
jgi:hypothetical protein